MIYHGERIPGMRYYEVWIGGSQIFLSAHDAADAAVQARVLDDRDPGRVASIRPVPDHRGDGEAKLASAALSFLRDALPQPITDPTKANVVVRTAEWFALEDAAKEFLATSRPEGK